MTSIALGSPRWAIRNSSGRHARRVRELVHERLDGEHVAERAQAPRRRRTDRAAADEVAGDTAVADVVERIGVAVGAAVEPTEGSWPRAAAGLGSRPGRQQARALGTDRERAAGVGVAVDVVVPRARCRPCSSSPADRSMTIAGDAGSRRCSSARDHCTFTASPGRWYAISAASNAASSAPLWP